MERPILFNGDMVGAILEGRKSQTRRVVKLPSHIHKEDNGLYTLLADGVVYCNQHFEQVIDYIKPPYQVGDTLWIRETWGMISEFANIDPSVGLFDGYLYATDGTYDGMKWHPSIHMPRKAARIFLKVTGVRVERLCEMAYNSNNNNCETVENFRKEGVMANNGYFTALHDFKNLWNSTIKKQDLDRYGWNANPYIWIIKFEVAKNER